MIERARDTAFPHQPHDWPRSLLPAGLSPLPPPSLTPYESLLTWLMLLLLGAPEMARPIPDADASPPHSHRNHLTPREREVLRLVTTGMTNVQIAERLFVSRRTVDQHIASIFNRLGVSSRAAATRCALLYDLC